MWLRRVLLLLYLAFCSIMLRGGFWPVPGFPVRVAALGRECVMSQYAAIAVEAPLTKVYHYRVPEHLVGRVLPGSRVIAPFGPRRIRGFCVELSETCPIDPKRCKDILEAGPEGEIVLPELLLLTRWAAGYYHTGWGMVLAASVPSAVRKGAKMETALYVSLAKSAEETELERTFLPKTAAKQELVLAEMLRLYKEDVPETLAAVLLAQTGAAHATLRGLEKKGLLKIDERACVPVRTELPQKFRDVILTPEQATALAKLNAALDARTFGAFLLYGITGSGKTEVYLRAMVHALAQGRTVLVLVPEISLTPQTVGRFQHIAGAVVTLHSNMSDGERAEAWRKLRRGEVKVVVGARSAVFSPLPDLGLIIVDEEHEHTFKQESDPRYHGRDLAVMRAVHEKAVVLLGSATPSLESWQNAQSGKYQLLTLTERPGGARQPQTKVVDMRAECAEQKKIVMFSRELEREIANCLHQGRQAILFLNRRGFNTFISCLSCGEPVKCPHCEVPLTFHKRENRLSCHYCDYSIAPPDACEACSSRNLRFSGTGTERVEQILTGLVPQARLLRMDSDTMTRRDSHASALASFARGEFDILLGTQMVTKGFDFPNVTLVGVLSADSAINLPDFRAAERTFQLVTQVVGRAGRGENPGVAVIQAFQPEHYAIQYALAQDFNGFAGRELAIRKPLGYPPFGKLARVVARGPDEAAVQARLKELAGELKKAAVRPLMVMGPNACPLPKLQDEYRFHLLIKGRTPQEIAQMLAAITDLSPRGGVRIVVDVDPVSQM